MKTDPLKYSFVILSIFIQSITAFTQTAGNLTRPVFRQVSYPFLPSITSKYFFFSEDGLMWFSSARGLTSFDGSGIIYQSSFQQTNEYELTNINCIAEDREHNLYIGTRMALLYFDRKKKSFSPLEYTFRDTKKSEETGSVSLYIDDNGLVYSGSISRGLIIYDPAKKEMQHVNLDTGKPDSWEDRINNTVICFAIHAIDRSRLWIGSYNGIYLFNKRDRTLSKNFKITTPQFNVAGEERGFYDIQKMDVADDSTIWFNIWSGGFASYSIHSGKVVIYGQEDVLLKGKGVPLYVIPSFVKLDPGYYLVATNSGSGHCSIFNTKTKSFHFLDIVPDPQAHDRVTFCGQDRRGNIWVLRNGLLYVSIPEYSRLQNVSIRKQKDLYLWHNYEMRGVYFDKAAQLYYFAVRYSDGIYVLDTNFKFLRVIPGTLCNNKYARNESCADKITKDGSGRLWATGWQTYIMLPGQKQFDLAGRVFPRLEWINRMGEFFDLLTTRNGDILLRDAGAGNVYLINHKTLLVDTIKIPRFNNQGHYQMTVSPLGYDQARDIAYLSNDYGIAQYRFHSKQMRELSYKEIFGDTTPNQRLLKSTIDAEGKIWLLKSHYGLRILDPETLLCVDSIRWGTRGLLSGYYTNIVGGEKDYLFLQGEHGVVVYNYRDQKSFLFDNNNGLVYPVAYSMLQSNHHLLLGQANSIEYYDYKNFPKNNFAFRPSLNRVMADTTEINRDISEKSDAIKLSNDQNTITLSFSAPEFVFPERIEYAYMLTGIDDSWKYTNYFNRDITYTKLSPGNYVFRLKAQMEGENWNTNPVEYRLIITPAWWQTGWFRLLCITAALALMVYVVQRRIQFIRKKEQQKSEHEKQLLELEAKALRAQMNPHFIFNCLNSIKALMQEEETAKGVKYLTTFSKLIRTLFNNADKKEISLSDEIETCKLYLQLEAMRFDAAINYTVDVDPDIDLKSVMIPALIIQPFIENAIWHGIVPGGTGGNIRLDVERNNGYVEIIVEDDGIGREVSQKNKAATKLAHDSKGVNLTQSRLELDNLLRQRHAKMEIIDKRDAMGNSSGTKVIIKIEEDTE
ncbi:MAG: histidine kinase [Ginsengibacter sp.]